MKYIIFAIVLILSGISALVSFILLIAFAAGNHFSLTALSIFLASAFLAVGTGLLGAHLANKERSELVEDLEATKE